MNEPNLIRKDTLTDKVIEKQKRILIIAVICVLTLFIGSSYALLTNFDKTDNVINFTTGNLNMSVTNSGNSLTLTELNGKLPETDQTGLQNATPIVLTLTNTGTINIMRYDVELTSDLNKTSTLNEEYIKYSISLDNGITYSNPKNLTDNNNIIYTGYNLDVDESKMVYLKIWIDESAGNNSLNKEYYGSVTVDLYQKADFPASVTIQNAIAEKAETTPTCKTTIVEDGITYISGTDECIDFNYVWYSGKLWRITAIYPDGTMKMITDDIMTTISWGTKSTVSETDLTSAYSDSYIRQWLNQEFLPTLYDYENIIVKDAGWYSITDSADPPTKPTGYYTLTDSVGLLNNYEIYMSYKNAGLTQHGYLEIRNSWWSITPRNSSEVSYTDIYVTSGDSTSGMGVRPTINLKSNITLSGGFGTESNPYIIKVNREEVIPNVTLINTRQSGEYVKLENDQYANKFRIVDTELVGENLTTKIVLNDYASRLNKPFSSGPGVGVWTEVDKMDTTYWRGYLNNTWIKSIDNTYNETLGTSSILEKGIYYLGEPQNYNYKTTVCSTINNDVSVHECIENATIVTDICSDDYVGLLRYGEMLASHIESQYYLEDEDMWLITPGNFYGYYYVKSINSSNQLSDDSPSREHRARPTINLKSTMVIKSGSGTKQDPFVVGLPS